MKKPFMIIVLFLLFSSIATAHTGLESSTPKADETVTYSVSKITLRFDTTIEASSGASITDGNGNGIAINDTVIENNIMTVAFTDPLTSGTYDVVWNIVGEDGHIIEDTYSFSVETKETEETADVSPDTDSAEEEPVRELAEESPETESAVTSEQRNLVPVAAGVMGGIIVIAGLFFLKRKKNSV